MSKIVVEGLDAVQKLIDEIRDKEREECLGNGAGHHRKDTPCEGSQPSPDKQMNIRCEKDGK